MDYQRKYIFKLYPTPEQAAVLRQQTRMVAELWNALLQRHEDIARRTVQRTRWIDSAGCTHVGMSVHATSWSTQYKRAGVVVTFPSVATGRDGRLRPANLTQYDMQNEVTWLCNQVPEWREMSVYVGQRVAASLSNAFDAFYRRAAAGAGASSGYPKFKRTDHHDAVPYRLLSGCKLHKDPRHERSWVLQLKGVPGPIHARGIFPTEVCGWTNADITYRDARWCIAVGVKVNGRRPAAIRQPEVRVAFDLLDDFVRVDGLAETPDGLIAARLLQDERDALQRDIDLQWPRGQQRSSDERNALSEALASRAAIDTKLARIRKNALHTWSCRIVDRAGALTIVAPLVRTHTRTPRGDERAWGANVEPVSELNRSTLSYAPAMAVQMLTYKAEEKGIRCDIVVDAAPKVVVGADLVSAGKQLRRIRRELRSIAA